MQRKVKNALITKPKLSKTKNLDIVLQESGKSKLDELIKIYNYAPKNAPLKSQQELEKEAKEATKQYDHKWSTEGRVRTASFLDNATVEQSENYPKLKECIANQALFGWCNEKRVIYFQFLDFRTAFNQLLENADMVFRRGYSDTAWIDSNRTIVFGFSDDGKYQAKSVPGVGDLFAEALEGVDLRRLLRCPVCDEIFWAVDLRQKYCSSQCRNNKNFRKWLSNPVNKDTFLSAKKASYKKNNPNSKIALLEKKEMEKHQKWRERCDRDFSKTEQK